LHEKAGLKDRRDILAALDGLKKYAWASPDNALLIGMSAGGFAVLSAGSVNPGESGL